VWSGTAPAARYAFSTSTGTVSTLPTSRRQRAAPHAHARCHQRVKIERGTVIE
jgi:hypothetical protein